MAESCVTVVPHLLYSSDTVCYDCFLFPKLKLYPAGIIKNHRTAGFTIYQVVKKLSHLVQYFPFGTFLQTFRYGTRYFDVKSLTFSNFPCKKPVFMEIGNFTFAYILQMYL
jgi:VanZ family protein